MRTCYILGLLGFQTVAIVNTSIGCKRHFTKREFIRYEITAPMLRKIREDSQWVNEANGPVVAVTLWVGLRGVVKTEKIGLGQNHL